MKNVAVWLLFALIVAFGRPLSAAAPSAAQRQCLLALQGAGAGVAKAASAQAVRCIRDTVRGRLAPSATAACLASESPALRQARARTLAAAGKECREAPDFGPADAERVNAAFSALADLRAVFGPNLASALGTDSADAKTARCRLSVAQVLGDFARTELAEYGRCSRKRLQRGELSSASDLQACVGAGSPVLDQARRQALRRVAADCADVPAASALPGRCAAATTSAELGACLTAQAHCGCCTAINGADGLAASCHRFEKGVAVQYCGERPSFTHSVARQWDEEILDAIRVDTPRPPVHARNLFHLSAAMYDAWAAYAGTAKPYFRAERPVSADPGRDRDIALSFAAYRVLAARYSAPLALGFQVSQQRFAARMNALGLDPSYTETAGDDPAAVGNRIAAAVLAAGLNDGANESSNYADPSYSPVNNPLIVKEPDIFLFDPANPAYRLDPNRWQPLFLDRTVTQNGIPLADTVQTFIGAQWGSVTPFAMTKAAPADLYLDPGPPPQLGGEGDAELREEVLELIELASYLTPDDPTPMDSSPGLLGNNPLASNAGGGHAVNPATGRPYAPQPVLRADFGRVLAEYWADGPHSETPPGHWNSIANIVADTPGFERRFAGSGPVLEPLEWDVKTYFALNGALHDAAIACWGGKRKYDGARPITLIRYMAKMGQSSDPALPSYNPEGLPLKPGLIELITRETALRNGRHAHLVTPEAGGRIGDIAVLAWPGSPDDVKTQYSGVRWVLGRAWVPYQRNTFVTPAFAGYYSGHSTFSRAAAEVLAALTGSPYFPGGLKEFVARKDAYLIHEKGPSGDVHLQWATYFDASDQAGRSRLWGGIHPRADDFAGRRAGARIGQDAFVKAAAYFDGRAAP